MPRSNKKRVKSEYITMYRFPFPVENVMGYCNGLYFAGRAERVLIEKGKFVRETKACGESRKTNRNS